MAIKTKEELMNWFRNKYKDSIEEDELQMTVDLDDTLNEFDRIRTENESKIVELQRKYDDNDKSWKEKYRNRFFGKIDNEEKEDENKDNEKKPEDIRFEDVFIREE